ncbi:MAG: O-antigen ligase family protein [candidate division FCPU426 bacterium]
MARPDSRQLAAERLGRWSLTAFALFAVASISLQNFIWLAAAAWVLGMAWRRGWKLPDTPVTLPLLLLAAVLVLSSFLAGRLNPSLFGVRKVGLMLAFFATAGLVSHPLKAERLTTWFLLGASLCAVWAIVMHLLHLDGGRAQSFSGDYMAAGGMFMLALILAASRWVYARAPHRWAWLACVLLLATALLLTYTRSSWIGAAVALVMLGLIRDWRWVAVAAAAAVLGLVLFPRSPVAQRVWTLTSKYHSSNVERKYMWASGLKLIQRNPLLGYGVDNLSEVYGSVADPRALEQRPPHVHNTLMQMAINGGLAAAGLYAWWIVALLAWGLGLWRRLRFSAPERAGTALGLSLAFLGFAVNGLFEFNFGTSQVITLVYFLAGLLPALGAADSLLPVAPRVLFLRPRFLGDVLLASGVPRLLARDYPAAEIDLLTEPASAAAAGGKAGWRQVLVLARRDLADWWRTLLAIRRGDYDATCDLFGNPRTVLLAAFSGARFRLGPQVRGWDWLLDAVTHADRPGPRPAWESYYDLLRLLGLKQLSQRPRWEVDGQDEAWVKAWLKQRGLRPGRLVGFFAGGSHPAKRWPLENFVQAAAEAQGRFKLRPVFVFGPLERELLKAYQRLGGKGSQAAVGLTPGQLAALWRQCAAVVSNDAFPMHMGPAVGTPTLGLFGPGDPRVWFAYPGRNGHKALHAPPSCWPCHRDACDDTQCWRNVTPALVLEALAAILKSGKKADHEGHAGRKKGSKGRG